MCAVACPVNYGPVEIRILQLYFNGCLGAARSTSKYTTAVLFCTVSQPVSECQRASTTKMEADLATSQIDLQSYCHQGSCTCCTGVIFPSQGWGGETAGVPVLFSFVS